MKKSRDFLSFREKLGRRKPCAMQHIRATEMEGRRDTAQPHQKKKRALEGPGPKPPIPHQSGNGAEGLAEEMGRGQKWDRTPSTHAAR